MYECVRVLSKLRSTRINLWAHLLDWVLRHWPRQLDHGLQSETEIFLSTFLSFSTMYLKYISMLSKLDDNLKKNIFSWCSPQSSTYFSLKITQQIFRFALICLWNPQIQFLNQPTGPVKDSLYQIGIEFVASTGIQGQWASLLVNITLKKALHSSSNI